MKKNLIKKISYYSILFLMTFNLIFPYSVFSLPQNGEVVSGQISIKPSDSQMNIHQQSQKAIINWDTFDIGASETVRFFQPGTNAAVLNRVMSLNPSMIDGVMKANGNVFLVNPNGVLIGSSGLIQTNSFLGSTLNISDQDFLNDSYIFKLDPGASIGSIINRGLIKAESSGYVSLLSPKIENHGTIIANMGKIHLAAGERIKLSFIENDLVSFAIDPEDLPETKSSQPKDAAINNFGKIQAEGGEILLSAKTAGDMVHAVVNNEGIIEANSLVNENGVIRLVSSDKIQNSGNIDVSGTQTIDEKGGDILLTGETIIITESSNIDASGNSGGGNILIGGGLHGSDDSIANAKNTFIAKDSQISSDAITNGDGGQIVVWGDQATIFLGDSSAKGGEFSGDGGFIEVSGKEKLFFDGNISTRAPAGKNGTLLLDPQDIYIVDGDTDDLDNSFSGQVNFTDIPNELTIAETRLELLSSETDINLQANNRVSMMDLTDNELTLNQTGSVAITAGAGGFIMNTTDSINITGGGHLLIDALGSENGAYPATDGPIALGTIRTTGIGNVTIQGTIINLLGPIDAGGTVTIENRDLLTIQRDILTGGAFLQKGPRPVSLGGDITTTEEISFTHDISLSKTTTRLTSRDGSIFLMNSKIVEGASNCELILDAESVISLNDVDITTLTFEKMNGGLVLNGDVQIVSAFDTTPVLGLLYVDEKASIRTNSMPVNFNTPLTLKAPLTIHTGDNSGDITFNDRLDGPHLIDLTAGTGNILFNQDIGKNSMIDGLIIRSSQNVTIKEDVLSEGLIDINYSSLLSQGGAIRTTGDNISLHGNVLLTDHSIYDTTISDGDIHIYGNINGSIALVQNLDITAGIGDITIEGSIGNSRIPGNINIISANNLTINGSFQANSLLHPSGTGNIQFMNTLTTYDGGIHLKGKTLRLYGNLNSNSSPIVLSGDAFLFPEEIQALDSSVTLYPHQASTTMGVEDITRDLNITNSQLHTLKTNKIVMGHVDNTGGISIAIDNTISQNKELQFISSGLINIQGTIVTGNNSKLLVTNYGELNVAPGARLTLDGGWVQDGGGLVSIGGSMVTTNDDIIFNGPVRLTGNLSMDTGTELGHIQFSDKLDGNYYLSATSGGGNILFGDQVGAEIPLNGMSLISSADIEIASIFHSGSMTITNNGILRLTSGADIQLDNAFLQQGIGPVELAGKITTLGENITFTRPVTLIGNASLNTGTGPGNILFNNIIDGGHILTMSAGSGDIELVEKIGSLVPLSGVLIQSGRNISVLAESVIGGESFDITAQNISITAPITTQNGGLLAFENSNLLTLSSDAILTLDGAFWQRSKGPVQLSTDIVTTGDEIKIEGSLTCSREIRLDSGEANDGNILLLGNVTSDHLLTINSGLGNVTLGQTVEIEGINILSANVLTIDGEIKAQNSGLNLKSQSVFINNNITTNQSSVNISNDQALNIASNTNLIIDGAFIQTGNGWVNIGGNIETSGQQIKFSGNVSLTGEVNLTTGLEDGNIIFEGLLDSSKDNLNSLFLDAGSASILFDSDVGQNDLIDLTIKSAQNVSFNSSTKLKSFTQESGAGLTHFKDNLYLGVGGFSFKGNKLSFNKDINTDEMETGIGMSIVNEGLLVIPSQSKVRLSGHFQQTGSGTFYLGADILTNASEINVSAPISLIDDASLKSTNSGDININQSINGNYQLNVSSGTGNLVLASSVGDHTALKGLTIENGNLLTLNNPIITQENGIKVSGDQIQISNEWITDGGDIILTGNTVMTDGIQWNTGNENGDILINGLINGTQNYEQDIILRAGIGNIVFQEAVGGQVPVGNINIQSSKDVSIKSSLNANSIKQISDIGETQIEDTITTQAGGIEIQNKKLTIQGNLDSNGKNIILIADQMTLPSKINAIDASVQLAPLSDNTPMGINHPEQTLIFDDASLDKIETSHLIFGASQYEGDIFVGQDSQSEFGQNKDLSFITNGNINITGKLSTINQKKLFIQHGMNLTVQGDLLLDGSFEEIGSGIVYWKGNLQTTNDNITFNQPVSLIGDSSWKTQNGLLTVNQTINGLHNLNVNTGSGHAIFNNDIGSDMRILSLSLKSEIADMRGIHTDSEGINIIAETIKLNGNISTLQGDILLNGQTNIMSNLKMETFGGKISFLDQLTDNDQSNEIVIASEYGDISFKTVNLGSIVFESGGNLTLNNNINVEKIWDSTKLKNILLNNDITIKTQNSDIKFKNSIDGHYALTLDTGEENTGYVYLSGIMGGTTALKELSVLDSAGSYVDGSIFTVNGDILFKRAVLLTNDLIVNTGTGVGDLRFEDKVYSLGDFSRNLDITTGGGNVTFLSEVGPNTALGTVTIHQAGNIYLYDNFRAQNISMTPFQNLYLAGSMNSTDGNIKINGNVLTTQNQLQLNSNGGNIEVSGKIDDQEKGHTLILNANTEKININDVSIGEIQITAADKGLSLNGDIVIDERFDSGNIAGPIILNNHASLTSRNTGYIILTPTIDGPFQFLINSNGGTVRIDRSIGANHTIQKFIINSAENVLIADNINTSTGEISISGNITLLKDNITFNSVIGDIVLNDKIDDAENDFKFNILTSAGNIFLNDIDIYSLQLEAPNDSLYLNGEIQLNESFDTRKIDGNIYIQNPVKIQTKSNNIYMNTDISLNSDLLLNTEKGEGSVFINGTVNGKNQLFINAGAGDIRFEKSIGYTEIISELTVLSGNDLTVGDSIRTYGNIHLDNTGKIFLKGNLQTINSGSSIVISDADMTLFEDRSIATLDGNIVLDALSPSVHDSQKLFLYAGKGNISIDHAVGSPELAFADIQILGATDVHLMGAEATINAKSFTVENTTGLVRLDGKITLCGDLNLNVHILQINAEVITTDGGKITIANSYEASILADMQSSGNVVFSGQGKIELDGDIDVTDIGNSFKIDKSILSLKDSHHIRTNNGNIDLYNISTEKPDEYMLNMTAGNGTIQINGPVGYPGQFLGGIHVIDAGNVIFAETDETLYANTLWIQSVDGETVFDRPVRIDGDIDVQTNNLSVLKTIETRNSGNISFETKGLSVIQSEVSSSGDILWNQEGDIEIYNDISSYGNISLNGTASINLSANIFINEQTNKKSSFINIDKANLILKGDHHIKTVNGNIVLNNVVTDTPDNNSLSLSSGNGNIQILRNVGTDTARMGSLVIADASQVAFEGKDDSINVNTLSIYNKDILTIKSDITSTGKLTFSGAGNILLAADLKTTGMDANISVLYSTIQLMEDCSIVSHHGDIKLANVTPQTDKIASLQLDANNNQIFFNGKVGLPDKSLSGLNVVNSDKININGNIHVSGDINLNTRILNLDQSVKTTDQGKITMNVTEKANIYSDITSEGTIRFDSTGSVMLNAEIKTTIPTANIEFHSTPLILSGDSRLQTQGGDIQLAAVNALAEEKPVLVLASERGDVVLNGQIGNSNQYLSEIKILSANDVKLASTANAIYTDRFTVLDTGGHTLIDTPLFVNGDVMIKSASLTINSDIDFKVNADITIITSGLTTLNTDLQVPGNILFDGKGDIVLAANIESTEEGKGISIPDAPLIVSGNHSLITKSGSIELNQIKATTLTDQLTLNPNDGDVFVRGSSGNDEIPLFGLTVKNAKDVSFLSQNSYIYASDHLNIDASGQAVFEGDVTVEKTIQMNVDELNIRSKMIVAQDVTFDILGNLTVMGLQTNGKGDITLISQSGNLNLGNIDAGTTGNIKLTAKNEINGGKLHANAITVNAGSLGLKVSPVLDTKNFQATLTGSTDTPFIGHIQMATPDANLPKSSQIKYLGQGLSIFLVEDMDIYGLNGEERSLYSMPILSYKKHDLFFDALEARKPEFFMIPPLNIDISLEEDKEIKFLEMEHLF